MKTDKKVHKYFLRKSATRRLFLKSLLKYLGVCAFVTENPAHYLAKIASFTIYLGNNF